MTVLATLESLTIHKDGGGPIIGQPDGIKGWWGGVSFRHESVDKPVGHGQFDAPAYRGPRLLNVEAQIFLPSYDEAAFESLMELVETVLDDGSMGTFAVHQSAGVYGVDVRRHDITDIVIVKYGRLARFQLPLWAPDGTKVLIP